MSSGTPTVAQAQAVPVDPERPERAALHSEAAPETDSLDIGPVTLAAAASLSCMSDYSCSSFESADSFPPCPSAAATAEGVAQESTWRGRKVPRLGLLGKDLSIEELYRSARASLGDNLNPREPPVSLEHPIRRRQKSVKMMVHSNNMTATEGEEDEESSPREEEEEEEKAPDAPAAVDRQLEKTTSVKESAEEVGCKRAELLQ